MNATGEGNHRLATIAQTLARPAAVRRVEARGYSRDNMYIPPWPGLTARDLLGSPYRSELCYPFSAPKQHQFCVARSGIYHLFRALNLQPGETVLMPDYFSGNEVAAVRAAGADVVFYPIRRNLDPDWKRLSELTALRPRVIYAIHYLGWAQPLDRFQQLCRDAGAILIEDCALSLLSCSGGMPLGSTGDYSVFCVYKTLPVPNGGLLVQNNEQLPQLNGGKVEPCPPMTSIGRTAELMFETLRSRWNHTGEALFHLKQAVGQRLRAADVRNVPVGDIGWNIANVNVGVSPLYQRVVRNTDCEGVVQKRRHNYLTLQERLRGRVCLLRDGLPSGMCPLFFPILVRRKHETAVALRARGIQAVEFWNDAVKDDIGSAARYLRAHVLELPIHQGVTPAQLDYIAREIERLNPEPAPTFVS